VDIFLLFEIVSSSVSLLEESSLRIKEVTKEVNSFFHSTFIMLGKVNFRKQTTMPKLIYEKEKRGVREKRRDY